MSSFLLRTVWWRWLRGAAVPVCPESSSPNGPFLCSSQTLQIPADSGPRQDPGHESQARCWAESGSGHNPRSARMPEWGEMRERQEWSWRMSWWRNWRGGKWGCRTEELLLWLWSDWGRWRELQLNASSSPCPEEERVEMCQTVKLPN